MGVDVSVDGQVVEIEDESCIDTERRRARQCGNGGRENAEPAR